MTFTAVNPVRAFRVGHSSKEMVISIAAGSDNLPATNIVAPGVYIVFGYSIDMTTEALYRVTDFNGRQVQVISYASNLDALLRAISWMTQYGSLDGSLTGAQFGALARQRKISTTCGGAALLASYLLPLAGFNCRTINGLREEAFNSYLDGHSITEIKIGGVWCAVDFIGKQDMWVDDGSGTGTLRRASALDIHDHLTIGDITFRPLASNHGVDSMFVGGLPPYAWFIDDALDNPLDYYRFAFNLPYIQNPSNPSIYDIMYETSAQQSHAASYGAYMNPITRSAFIAAYYS